MGFPPNGGKSDGFRKGGKGGGFSEYGASNGMKHGRGDQDDDWRRPAAAPAPPPPPQRPGMNVGGAQNQPWVPSIRSPVERGAPAPGGAPIRPPQFRDAPRDEGNWGNNKRDAPRDEGNWGNNKNGQVSGGRTWADQSRDNSNKGYSQPAPQRSNGQSWGDSKDQQRKQDSGGWGDYKSQQKDSGGWGDYKSPQKQQGGYNNSSYSEWGGGSYTNGFQNEDKSNDSSRGGKNGHKGKTKNDKDKLPNGAAPPPPNDIDEGQEQRKNAKGASRKDAKDAKDSKDAKGNGKSKGKDPGKNSRVEKEDDAEPAAPVKKKSGGTGAVTMKHLSDTRFDSLSVCRETKRGLAEAFGYEMMTEVQAQTVKPLLDGQDIVARAKTGTGKTLAFLLPIVEKLRGRSSGAGGPIAALILSPTRELSCQIMEEAKLLLTFHKLGVDCFYGGRNIKTDHRALSDRPLDILVATPGRMQDHLDNTDGFRQRLSKMQFFVLDEADQLLDMGFRDSILKLIGCLPSKDSRQNMLFSATFPKSVSDIAKMALRASNVYIDTIKPDDEVTPDQIDQSYAMSDIDGMTETFWSVLQAEMKREPQCYKIMVFFVTARLTQFYSELFRKGGVDCLEIHSRKSQAFRTSAADKFRNSQRGIIFSSDVSARGVDYPDVTAVIQVGVPSDRNQYIHRLGRTGRAGKSGCCYLCLHDFESYFLRQVKDLPLKEIKDKDLKWSTPPRNMRNDDPKLGGQAYQAWLGYYNSQKGVNQQWTKEQLVEHANWFATSIGATRDGLPPPILKKTVGMMGLKGVRGLNIVDRLPYQE